MKKLFILMFCMFILTSFTLSVFAGEGENEYSTLISIKHYCEKHKDDFKGKKYYVPGAWTVNPLKSEEELGAMVKSGEVIAPVSVDSPYILLEKTIDNIMEYDIKNKPSETIDLKNGKGAIAVNFLPRVLSMYDHDGDGHIGSKSGDITLNSSGVLS